MRFLERRGEAEEEIDWLLERYPGWAKVRLEAAQPYLAHGRRDDAIAQLEAALKLWSEADLI